MSEWGSVNIPSQRKSSRNTTGDVVKTKQKTPKGKLYVLGAGAAATTSNGEVDRRPCGETVTVSES